jgi:hypothetical protein
LRESLWSIASKSAIERAEYVLNDIVVQHPNVARAYNYIDYQLFGPRRSRAKGLLLSGPVGSGKTTFGKLIKRSFQLSPNDYSVMMISLSGTRDMRGVYGRILESLNGPVSSHQRTPDRELAVMRLFREIKCRLLILDEVQDVVENTVREQRRTLHAVKFLMNEFGLPIVALGTENGARAFLSDPHLDARFEPHQLPTWKADNDLLDFLRAIEGELPLREPSSLCTTGVVEFLASQSKGMLDAIMTLIRNAAIHAMMSGEERITIRTLEQAKDLPDMRTLKEVSHVAR